MKREDLVLIAYFVNVAGDCWRFVRVVSVLDLLGALKYGMEGT